MVYFIPTPIGNRGDFTLRAIEILKEVDMICCEDTRHSKPLLLHYEINKQLTSLHDHNEGKKAPEIIQLAESGKSIAIITDAGMPSISDPGYRMMQACIAADIEYTVLPGPSAVLTALVGSGFPVHAFTFMGFLSVKKGKRGKELSSACASDITTIFFESPHRLKSTLEILAKEHPDQQLCIARELTKKFETYHKGTSTELDAYFKERTPKGEIVFLIAPLDYTPPSSSHTSDSTPNANDA